MTLLAVGTFLSINLPKRGPGPFHRNWHTYVVLNRLLVGSIFLSFEAPKGHWDVLLDPLKTVADLHLDSFYIFYDGDSSYICNSLFSLS